MHYRMNVFAHGDEQDIEVACDASLDEGDAVIRTRFEPGLGSAGTEYFPQFSLWEAKIVNEILTGVTGVGQVAPGDIEGVIRRLNRIIGYIQPPDDGIEFGDASDFDMMGDGELRQLAKELAARSLSTAEIAAIVDALDDPELFVMDHRGGWVPQETYRNVLRPALERLRALVPSGDPGQRTIATFKFDITDLSEREREIFLGAVEAQREGEADTYRDVEHMTMEVTEVENCG